MDADGLRTSVGVSPASVSARQHGSRGRVRERGMTLDGQLHGDRTFNFKFDADTERGLPRLRIETYPGRSSRDDRARPLGRRSARCSSTRPLLPLQEVERGVRALGRRRRRDPHARRARRARPSAWPPPSASRSRRAQSRAKTFDALLADLEAAIKGLAATRPTAVNLFWALERMRRAALALARRSRSTPCARGCSRRRRRSATRTSRPTARWASTARRWCPTARASSRTATPARWPPRATARRSA